MKIESLKIKNFKTFRNVDIPNFCVLRVPMEQEKVHSSTSLLF